MESQFQNHINFSYQKYIEKNDVGKDCSNHNVHVGNFSYFGRTSSLCSLSGYSRFRYRSSPLPPAERVLSFASKLTRWPPSAPCVSLTLWVKRLASGLQVVPYVAHKRSYLKICTFYDLDK